MQSNKCESCGASLRPEQIQCDYCGSFVKYTSYKKEKCDDFMITKCSGMTMYDINTGKPIMQFSTLKDGELWIKEKL